MTRGAPTHLAEHDGHVESPFARGHAEFRKLQRAPQPATGALRTPDPRHAPFSYSHKVFAVKCSQPLAPIRKRAHTFSARSNSYAPPKRLNFFIDELDTTPPSQALEAEATCAPTPKKTTASPFPETPRTVLACTERQSSWRGESSGLLDLDDTCGLRDTRRAVVDPSLPFMCARTYSTE